LQGTTWIKNNCKDNDLHVLWMNDPKILSNLEMCIKQGSYLLIEDMPEQIDPILEPILMNQFIDV